MWHILQLKTKFPVQNTELKITSVIITLAQVRSASQVWLTIDVYLMGWKICSGACGCPDRAGAPVTLWAGHFQRCQRQWGRLQGYWDQDKGQKETGQGVNKRQCLKTIKASTESEFKTPISLILKKKIFFRVNSLIKLNTCLVMMQNQCFTYRFRSLCCPRQSD